MEEKWELSVWGGKVGKHSSLSIQYKGKYNAQTIENVYEAMDVLIVPSVWKETFSLVTLEALSYGVPVIVSDNVGAQDNVGIHFLATIRIGRQAEGSSDAVYGVGG